MGSTDLALSWKDHHGVLFNVFEKLLAKKSLVDCTLAAEGKFLKAHRIVLSACSPYFEALLDQEHDKHPIIFLRDVQFEDLKTLLEFVYSGEIKIPENRLVEFLNVAEALQIKGLGGVGNEGQVNKSSTDVLPQRETRSPVPRKRTRRHSSSSDGSSRDRAEIIPVSSESSRPKSNSEKIVPVANNASTSEPVPRQTSVVPSEDLNPNVKVKEEIITPVQSTCSDLLSSDQSADNEEILGLKPEFEQVTFTEDYSDDMLPEDSDSVDHVIDQDQPSSSQQYSGFSAESAKAGELSIHPPFAVGGVNQPVPEGSGTGGWRLYKCGYGGEATPVPLPGYQCADCPRSFASEDALRRHRASHGPPAEQRPHGCPHCPARFAVASNLTQHLRTHTGERPYECEFCRKRFAHSKTLKDHRRTHTGERPYTCVYCKKGFSQSVNLRTHVLTHTGELPFPCRLCSKSFRQRAHLQNHMRTTHPDLDSN